MNEYRGCPVCSVKAARRQVVRASLARIAKAWLVLVGIGGAVGGSYGVVRFFGETGPWVSSGGYRHIYHGIGYGPMIVIVLAFWLTLAALEILIDGGGKR